MRIFPNFVALILASIAFVELILLSAYIGAFIFYHGREYSTERVASGDGSYEGSGGRC